MNYAELFNLTDRLNQPGAFLVLLFAAVSVLAYAVFSVLARRYDNPLRQRLREGSSSGTEASLRVDALAKSGASGTSKARALPPIVDRIGRAAAKPIMPKQREEQSQLRKRLARAGYYAPSTMHLLVGAKLILLIAGALSGVLVALATEQPILGLWLGATAGLFGFALPGMWLSWRMRLRQEMLQSSLPDALDLMVVCVEAGLTIDAALQRVGQEIALAHPEISRELAITHMETRIGVARVDALRNLGQRTGCAALQSLAAMLVQAERFGTSIGAALRVHAESLRIKRQHDAEERAAKTTVKLAFPVVLFIFPTVIAVLGGPAFILFYKSPLFDN